MQEIKRELENLLKTDYSPYDYTSTEPDAITIDFAFNEVLEIKKSEIIETSYKDYNSRVQQLKKTP